MTAVEVSEVHFELNSRIRISRTCRMNWFLDYKFINFSLNTSGIQDRDFVINGAETVDGAPLAKNALLRMTPTTKALFFAGIYKKSIVLDFSPGCFAADDYGEIMYTNMLPALKKLLVELLNPFKYANNTVVHYPRVCITLIAYTPFVQFQHPPVLIHGAWVMMSNLDQFLIKAEAYVRKFIEDLDVFMHPINIRREASEAASYRMKLSDASDTSIVHDAFPLNDKVSIDFRLIQMVRLGILGIQIAPKSAHASLLIVTDGVLYIPDQAVIQSIALGLRASGVVLSFLQVVSKNAIGCLGLVPSNDMLCFLAKATFGTHLIHDQVLKDTSTPSKNGIFEHPTSLQKDFLAWSCQREPYEMEPPLPMYIKDLISRTSQSSKFKSVFFMLFHVRLREGYTLRSLALHTDDSKQYISATFSLPWSIDSRIDYKISTLFADTEKDDLQVVSQEVCIKTNYLPTRNPKDNAMLAALFVRESEEFAIKLISFRSNPNHYETKDYPFYRYPGLYVFLRRNRPFPTLAIKTLENSVFNAFWQPLLVADVNALRRCCHIITHRFSVPYFIDEDNIANFWPDTESSGVASILKPKLMEAVYKYFSSTTTFCLASKYSYVKIIRDKTGNVPPNACFFVRIHTDSTLLTIHIVFVGDWSIEERNQVSNQIRRELKELEGYEGLLMSIARGTDGKLIRYRKVPPLFGPIMPPGISSSTKPCWSTRLKIHQMTLGRFLIPHRHIYKVAKDFDDYSLGQVALEGMNFIVLRRRMDGYRIGFREAGTTNLIREVICEQDTIDKSINLAQRGSRLDQCIIFPPVKQLIVLRGASVQQLREYLHVVGKSLIMQDAVLGVDNSPGAPTKLASSDETMKAPNPEIIKRPFILKKSDDSCNTPVAVVESLEGLTGNADNWSTTMSIRRRGVHLTPERITLQDSTGLKLTDKPPSAKPLKKKQHKKGKRHLPQGKEKHSSENSETLLALYAPNDDSIPQDSEILIQESPPNPLPALPVPLSIAENSSVSEEEYLEKGCFITTEYWVEPTELEEPPSGDITATIEEDEAMLSALVTFRGMQVELDRAPGIGTAVLGAEPYSTRVKPCLSVEITPNVSYHPYLYNIVKMCRCGERRLMLFPTLKYVFTDKDRNSRLGRILDSFNRELRSYMSQYFDFEDHDGTWATLAAGLESELKFVDEVELEKAQKALKAAEAPKLVNQPLTVTESETDNEQIVYCDSTETGTPAGYDSAVSNTTGSNASINRPRKMNEAAELLASLDMDALTKKILGEKVAPRKIANSKILTNSPKSLDGSVSSSMAPAGLQDDDDDNDAPYLPTMKRTVKSLHHQKLMQKLSSTNGSQNILSGETTSTQVENRMKRRRKRRSANASRNASFTSFDRESIRSGKRLPEDQIDLAPLAFSVYYKRRDPKTVIVVIVPATCRAVIAITNSQVPRLPVLAFMIEEDRLLSIFKQTRSLPKEFPHRSVMNFCTVSTLSALNLQVNAKFKESNVSPTVESPFERSFVGDHDPDFADLTDFCGNVVHDLLFSRAYAHAAYTCLGINVAVPQIVLKEVLEERCIQTSVSVNSIQEVLRVTCTHLSSYLQSKRCSRYRRHQMPNVSTFSDLSSASDSDIEVQQIMNPFQYSESENDEICRMERTEFTHAFESVLKRHKFYKVPNFGEYYFYWPKKRPKSEGNEQHAEAKKLGDKNVDDKIGILDKKKEERRFDKKIEETPEEDYESGTDKTNQSETTDEESNFDDSFEVDMQPLFLQFYVGLERHGKQLNSYPVGFIPNCLKEVMNTSTRSGRLNEEERSQLSDFDVKIEMFILTVPGMTYNDFSADEIHQIEDDQINTDARLKDFEDENNRPSLDLPRREVDVILKLCDDIHHMLETEKILILSRYFDTQKSYRNITRVMRFVQKEAKQVDERTQVQMAANDTLFVINEQEGKRRLAKRLEGATFSYCKIQCVKDEHSKRRTKPAMVFYCCSVDDFGAFCKEHSANAKLVKFDFVPKKKLKRSRYDTVGKNGNEEDDNTTATDEITGSSTTNQKSNDMYVIDQNKSDDENSSPDVEDVFELDENGTKEGVEDVESNPDLDEKVKRKQIVHDFWLLAKFDLNYVRSYFFQRPSGVHTNLFNKFTAKLQAEIKLVNQALLLEDMYERGEALPYLICEDVPTSPKSKIEPEPDPVQYPERVHLTAYAQKYAYRPSESNTTDDTDDVFSTNAGDDNGEPQDLISDSDNSSNLRVKYQFGYFACSKVWHHWFGINPRLRREPNVGIKALMDELESLQLLNRKNVYKIKDANSNVFYMSLFNDVPSVIRAIPTEDEKFIEEVKQRIESSVVLIIFGIATPAIDVTQRLMQQLQKRLDAQVLEELQSAVYEDPQLGLEPTDVSFLQHNPDAPSETFLYSLPSVASEYLASVHTYLEQHLTAYFVTPKYAEPTVMRSNSIDYYTSLVVSNCTKKHRFPGSHFEYFPLDGINRDPMPIDYKPLIFVINKAKKEGQKTSGMGCFEVRLVNRQGKVVDSHNSETYSPGMLGNDSFSLLYPGFSGAKPFSRSNKFQDQTKCTLVESLETDANFIASEHFVAFYVWQSGDIGLQELKTRLRILCQQAMADVVLEFGVLSQPILEPVPPPASPEEVAICGSPLNRQNSDTNRMPLNKRNSDAASWLQTVPFNFGPPKPSAPTTPIAANKNNFIVPSTVFAVDTPPPKGAPTKTRLLLNTGWASVASQGLHRIGYKPSISWIEEIPKVTQFSTWIPLCIKNTPEMLRQDFVDSVNNFFNFMSRESQCYSEMSQSFSKTRFVLDSARLAPIILRVVYAKFVEIFESDSVVVLKQSNTLTSQRLETMTDFRPLMHNSVIFDKGHAVDLKDDFRVMDYVVIVQNRAQMSEAIMLSQHGGTPGPELKEAFENPKKAKLKFGPKAKPFVPRRRILFITIKGEILTLFQYNMEAMIMQTVTDIVERAVFWNNARCRLLREIGLHKMRISHLTTFSSGDARDELYQPLKWQDPQTLVSHDYPPNNFRPTDYSNAPKELLSKFLRLYNFYDSHFVLKHNSVSKFDDQVTQFLALRQDIQDDVTKTIDLKQAHSTFLNGMGNESVLLLDDILFRILDRVQEIHYVQTPVLLFPEWRKKVAPIRGTTTNEHGSVSRRKQNQSTPTKNPVRKRVSLDAKMKPRSQTVTQSMLPALCRTNVTDEALTLKLQGQLMSEYANFLIHHLNAVLVKMPRKVTSDKDLSSMKSTRSPVNWLVVATSAGFVLLHLSFVEPYFCLRVLTWDKSQIKLPVSNAELNTLNCVKNSIVSQCHLHSFTYDFHLRIVGNYLTEEDKAPFSRGYNTSAFLIDFLQYYICRPLSARNCIFEMNCVFNDNLRVPGSAVWEDFLKNHHKYAWKVVKLKVFEKEDADEFMLVSSDDKIAANYTVIRLVTNTTPFNKTQENEIHLRYYVLMVANNVECVEIDGTPSEASAFRLVDQTIEVEMSDDAAVVEGELIYDSSGSSEHGPIFKRNKLRSSGKSITSGMTNVSERLSDLDISSGADALNDCPSSSSIAGTLIDDNMAPPLSSTFTAREMVKRPKGSATQIHREPPRAHRKQASGTYTESLRLMGQIPREQVTYVQYINSFQTSLQKQVEIIAKDVKQVLTDAVAVSDHCCFVEYLWRKMLSSRSIEPNRGALSLLQRLDGTMDPSLKHVSSTELTSAEWEIFLTLIRRDPMEDSDPRVLICLADANYQNLFRFFVQYFEGEKRCRYFDFVHSKNLIISNCLYLENSTLIEYRDNRISMAFLYEYDTVSASNANFVTEMVARQFDEIMRCLSAFVWTDLLANRPLPSR